MCIVVAAALAVLLTLTACNSSGNRAGSTTTSASSSRGSTLPSGAPAHNDADVAFAHDMIPHHQQAIQMSNIILGKEGIDPRVIQLANQIKAAQGPEIQQMQAWLAQWGQPTMPTIPSANMTAEHPMPEMANQSGMPPMGETGGMMSEQDMQALQNAQGVDASKLFLTQMIKHHQGAITMAQKEIKSGHYQPATALAQSIVTSQQQEINTMQSILGSL